MRTITAIAHQVPASYGLTEEQAETVIARSLSHRFAEELMARLSDSIEEEHVDGRKQFTLRLVVFTESEWWDHCERVAVMRRTGQ